MAGPSRQHLLRMEEQFETTSAMFGVMVHLNQPPWSHRCQQELEAVDSQHPQAVLCEVLHYA